MLFFQNLFFHGTRARMRMSDVRILRGHITPFIPLRFLYAYVLRIPETFLSRQVIHIGVLYILYIYIICRKNESCIVYIHRLLPIVSYHTCSFVFRPWIYTLSKNIIRIYIYIYFSLNVFKYLLSRI